MDGNVRRGCSVALEGRALGRLPKEKGLHGADGFAQHLFADVSAKSSVGVEHENKIHMRVAGGGGGREERGRRGERECD